MRIQIGRYGWRPRADGKESERYGDSEKSDAGPKNARAAAIVCSRLRPVRDDVGSLIVFCAPTRPAGCLRNSSKGDGWRLPGGSCHRNMRVLKRYRNWTDISDFGCVKAGRGLLLDGTR
jgi:hypothetical protein